jgi:predicted signal transduction protein with EAL and GGDEF domain
MTDPELRRMQVLVLWVGVGVVVLLTVVCMVLPTLASGRLNVAPVGLAFAASAVGFLAGRIKW